MTHELATSQALAKAAFLDALRAKFTVRHAAREAGVGRRTVYDWRDADAEFAAAWDEAREDAVEALEQTMYEKALAGETLPGFFMLKGMRPNVYRDNVRLEVAANVVSHSLADFSVDDRLALLRLAQTQLAQLSDTAGAES